ncbi:uncharacterized protein HMPREF1541_07527 [Cyphellophora europaea CBS 101466]|uniref:Uncharacterized protein n=1 Tax=Cyphellophora europaea (strain CBS 101466) TaxID=1220924 RepID=W2RQB5_CYPE1|nr:uncharacterized protein HMPREF1541_07527 [Cyphellophora europaea CBS 101466]ETN37904.1 hypothetical protein HMPREF1541_07527 [Cyphellophora europaea CBS 101466]
MAPTASSVLGKRKQSDRTVDIEVRIIFENHWATDVVAVPAAATFEKFFDNIKAALPTARRHSILGEELTAPRAFLQETTAKVPGLRKTKYMTVRWFDTVGYNGWYQRNVVEGDQSVLKGEIHLRTNTGAMLELQAEEDEVLKGTGNWTKASYIRLGNKGVVAPNRHVWKEAEAEKNYFVGEMELPTVSSTEEWFPERCVPIELTRKKADLPERAVQEINGAEKAEGAAQDQGSRDDQGDFIIEVDLDQDYGLLTKEDEDLIDSLFG